MTSKSKTQKVVSSPEEAVLTLKQMVETSGKSAIYLRRVILEGKLPSTKAQIGDTKVYRHEVKVSDFEAWLNATGTRSRRADGRNKFFIYANSEELEILSAFLKEKAMELPIERAHKPKAEAEVSEG